MWGHYIATSARIDAGYVGQVVEWPEVVTEGKDIEECRLTLQDAPYEIILAYGERNWELPPSGDLIQ